MMTATSSDLIEIELKQWQRVIDLSTTLETRLTQRAQQVKTLESSVSTLNARIENLLTDLRATSTSLENSENFLQQERLASQALADELTSQRDLARTERDNEYELRLSLEQERDMYRSTVFIGGPILILLTILGFVL